MFDRSATRAEGEALLRAFTPRMGRKYAQGRNTDHGPGAHRDVSTLSPYIRRRLVLEKDAVAAALAAHGPEMAEKFIDEVFWRGYFKGWLERRPQVWADYVAGLERDLVALDLDGKLRRAVLTAEGGQTGLECFDAWAQELVETGYLHNHARMWFASIWIFTLELPWRLGADFFYRHLLDGDAASNTLGWRWVAGLHTRGKAYQAEAWNIAKFTAQRFTPRDADLAQDIRPLDWTEPDGLPALMPLRTVQSPREGVPTLLLLTDEDCRAEDFPFSALDLRGSVTLAAAHLRSPRDVADGVLRFEEGALADAVGRASVPVLGTLRAGVPRDLASFAAKHGARQIATPYIPEGPLRDWLRQAEPALKAEGITLSEWRRDWDSAIWPQASAGFFKVRQAIPRILQNFGMI
ncbi:MAG: FAD-binding domain-containing protein [Roseinatronobacter sp.]